MMSRKTPRISRELHAKKPARGLALALICGVLLVAAYTLYAVARPVYWKLYAEVTHRHIADSDVELRSRLVSELLHSADGSGNAAQQQQQQQQQQARPRQHSRPFGRHGQPGAVGQNVSTAQQQKEQQQQQQAVGGGDGPISSRAEAHKQEWEGEWKKQWEEMEARKKAAQIKAEKAREHALIKKYNITLTRDSVQGLARDGLLFVTFANHHYTQFALTWVHHARRNNMTNFIVGSMDEEILFSLAKREVYTFAMNAGLPTGDFGWGSKTFGKMGRKKIRLIATFLQLGVQVVITDIDALWLRDPTPFFQRYPDADILTSSDKLRSSVGKEEVLEKYPEAGSAFNIGIMLLRPKALALVEAWSQKLAADEKIWDQNAFNDLVRGGQVIQEDDPNHYFLGHQGALKIGVLPVAWFSNGHAYFVQGLHKKLGTDPYCVHAIFQFGGTSGKRHRFREAMLWLDGSEYYTSKGGFLAYEPDIPKQLLERAGPLTGMPAINNTLGHFDLVNHQLRQLRNALALATTLGRALILPALWCGLDRYWAPHAGTIPGANTTLPFQCPADHVLRLEEGWSKAWPAAQHGPAVDFKEHSFLANPATPEAVKRSAVVVAPCEAGSPGCADGTQPATVEKATVQLAKRLSSDRILMALSSVSSVSVITFKDVGVAFGNFSRAEDWAKFAARVRHYGDAWCCVDHHPGHVYYDLLWDVPHKDMHNRQWNGTWRVTPGP